VSTGSCSRNLAEAVQGTFGNRFEWPVILLCACSDVNVCHRRAAVFVGSINRQLTTRPSGLGSPRTRTGQERGKPRPVPPDGVPHRGALVRGVPDPLSLSPCRAPLAGIGHVPIAGGSRFYAMERAKRPPCLRIIDELAEGGYAVPTGGAQLDALPWVNVDRVTIAFNEAVMVEQGDLAVHGVNVPEYATAGFEYDAATLTATWTLASPLSADRILLSLADSVVDAVGNSLDGEWTDATGTYASGDGQAGGEFQYRVNVLPGDVDGSGDVRSADVIKVRRKGNTELPQQAFDSLQNGSVPTRNPEEPYNQPPCQPELTRTKTLDSHTIMREDGF
jgi:hypothetical protein